MGAVVVVAMIVSWVFAVFLLVVLYGLTRQHAEMLVRLESTEESLRELLQRPPQAPIPAEPAPQPALLEVGARAPEFRLHDLAGRSRQLRDFLGGPLLLVFFDPQCGFCQQLAPRLGQVAGAPRLLVVSRRAPEETQRLAVQHGWRCDVVVEPGWDVASSYGTNGTPTGYLIDAGGRIASTLAVGADALLALAA